MQRVIGTAVAVLAASAPWLRAAAADGNYPVRPIRLIVTAAAGGNADIIARLVGQRLADGLHQQVVIDNRPGANSVIATEIVARAAPDGYTLLLVSNAHTSNPSLGRRLPYDTLGDFAPVSLVATVSNILVANPGVAANSVKELIALARANPGRLNYGSSGNGSNANLAAELFKSMAGVNLVHVPYKATAQVTAEVIGGQIELAFASITSVMPHIKSGKVKAFGITGAQRSQLAPDLPTIAEAGVPGYQSSNFNGILARAATPRDIIARLNHEIVRQIKSAETRERYASLGADPQYSSPAEFDAFIRAEITKWAKVIREAGIRVDPEN